MVHKMENKDACLAHVRRDSNGKWVPHPLVQHLIEVAKLAEAFAGPYGSDVARLAGLGHDLGKFREKFQTRLQLATGYNPAENNPEEEHLEQKAHKASHSHAGAIYFRKWFATYANGALGDLGDVLSYLIAGHHTGLPDWTADLITRLESTQAKAEFKEIDPRIFDSIISIPDTFENDVRGSLAKVNLSPENYHIWIRFLFSCLVDADFLDTEKFMDPKKSSERYQYPSLDTLHERFTQKMDQFSQTAPKTELNSIRNEIRHQCLKAAHKPDTSIFKLTVPTGGGKTLASLAFALEHAKTFGKKRIIYAIPFTTIIEQNAQVFRNMLDVDSEDSCVIEHHSNIDEKREDKEETARSRLAAENWDAPVIVTTNVQLFESLFASKTSRCRKIHNIADSVIVLDEVQKIPRKYLEPITRMIDELSKNYGVTWLMCTATQPDLSTKTDAFGRTKINGLNQYSIIEDEEALFNKLRRTDVHFPEPEERLSWPEVAQRIAQEKCALAVVNTRSDAVELYEALTTLDPQAIVIHLSVNMCAAHRKLMITLIREILQKHHHDELDINFYVVSTQLIEAGVDVDFPIVYRAMAGLDSIAQAAGRCNREGRMATKGQVYVFQPEKTAPAGELHEGESFTRERMDEFRKSPLSPTSLNKYFTQFFFSGTDLDKQGITELLTAKKETGTFLAIRFRTATKNFQFIENQDQVSVVCPFHHAYLRNASQEQSLQDKIKGLLDSGAPEDWLSKVEDLSFSEERLEVETWLNTLESDGESRWVYRKLQPYTTTISKSIMENNKDQFYEKAGLIVAKEYSFRIGVVSSFAALQENDCCI